MYMYIKGHVSLNISDSQAYTELCQIHETSEVSKTFVFMWQNFQDDSTDLKNGPILVSTKLVLPILIDFSLTVKAFTLIFISGRGSHISSAKEGKSGCIYNLVKSY